MSSSDFDFPIVGVLGGRAITIGPAMVSLEGANSGDPSGDPLGILGGSESKTGDPGVLYFKKPKDSGGSCARSVPLSFGSKKWLHRRSLAQKNAQEQMEASYLTV